MASELARARDALFQQLKGPCVAINNLAPRSADKKAASRELISVTGSLFEVLHGQVSRDGAPLDEHMANYVFYALSSILRIRQDFPILVTENTIKCMSILIRDGWKGKISMYMSQQLLILFTFLIGGEPGKPKPDAAIPEECKLEALRALTALMTAVSSSALAAGLLADIFRPALGHTVTILLDAVVTGETAEIRVEAMQAVIALYDAIDDASVLSTFLPGTVSSLTRLLTPPAALKTQKRVLVKGIDALRAVLVSVLADVRMIWLLKKKAKAGGKTRSKDSEGKVLTAPWLEATASQIKLALSSVLKLRSHDSEDVRLALSRLCIGLLDECHQSLAVCSSILVESAMVVHVENRDRTRSVFGGNLHTSLTDLACVYPELSETVKVTLYNWVTSLPRVMQSSDEAIKRQAIGNLLTGQQFITELEIDSSTLDDCLGVSLRDSVTVLISSSKAGVQLVETRLSAAMEFDEGGLVKLGCSRSFPPVLMSQESQMSTRSALINFISKGTSLILRGNIMTDMINYAQESTGPTQVASYWLAFELVKAALAHSFVYSALLDMSILGGPPKEPEQALQELYSFSVGILDSREDSEETDWSLQALALEVTTYTASRMGGDFRPELIDVLYPIATFMGSAVPRIREHAMVSLNSIAASCGYANVAGLMMDNADYMVNSVSLRLNTFDISPASIQVLRMMVKLAGPQLIPFLDDVIASIFAALDNYHGYTLFVENLFSVLAEIVNQGAKSDLLTVDHSASQRVDHRKRGFTETKIQDIGELLCRRADRIRKRKEEDKLPLEHHPKKPWNVKAAEDKTGVEEEASQEDSQVEKGPAPKTPTYSLLSRITSLTQHYLTSPTPTLRKSLLDLLTIVFPALAPDEEAFLPIVNDVWPVLLSRLYDAEPFVVIAACKALSALCLSAGDFLSTRFKTEWWEKLGRWCAKVKSNARRPAGQASKRARPGVGPRVTRFSSRHHDDSEVVIPIRTGMGLEAQTHQRQVVQTGLGEFAQAWQMWDAVRGLLVAIVTFVRVDDDVLDQILDLLADGLAAAVESRTALEVVNPDAVWLAMYEAGRVPLTRTPAAHFVKL